MDAGDVIAGLSQICCHKHVAEETIYGPGHIDWDEFVRYPTEMYEWPLCGRSGSGR